MIRFNPFTCTLTKNNKNINDIINILHQYDYDKRIRKTPQIYATSFNELENYYAIDDTIKDLLVNNNRDKFAKSYYNSFDIKYYIKRYQPDFIVKGRSYEYYNNTKHSRFHYNNYLLTRLWFERKVDKTEVTVLMEKGNFHYSYLYDINYQHSFNDLINKGIHSSS